MSDFKTRLGIEVTELTEKLDKLDNFLMSDKCESIDPDQKTLMVIQAGAMNTYLQCLATRLEKLK